MSRWRGRTAPSLDDIADLAAQARERIPAPFAAEAARVAIRVEDFADEAVLDELEIEDPFELTGLYDGIPMTQKSVLDVPLKPDTIWLFRAAILDEWCDRGDVPLDRLVAHVYVHELAHHFGWSDDDIARVDRWWE
jgi:predicted Zn-dependent protease with MMP-like domain